MGCGGVGDVDNVASSNSMAVPRRGKKSRRDVDNLSSQQIQLLKSPLASLFFFIQKKDGSLCPVQDYCYLNSITIKNKYPLPLILDLIDKLKNAMIFTKFDVQ